MSWEFYAACHYRDQMYSTIDAVTRHFPDTTRHTIPRGGHVLWVQLPTGVDATGLYEAAADGGVQIAPGPMFSPSHGYSDFIRLNTGFPWNYPPESHRVISLVKAGSKGAPGVIRTRERTV